MNQQVLIVDDIAINREILCSMLQFLGFTVHVTNDGYEALELLSRRNFDIILMDWHMPGMDGLAATRRLREIEASQNLPRTKTIIVSASAISSEVAQCMAAGADGHLAKPFRLEELEEKMARWLAAN